MQRKKLFLSATLALAIIALVMLLDYTISILILNNPAGYTPLVTLAIASIVTLPVTYVIVSTLVDLRTARDALALARDEADKARSQIEQALLDVQLARSQAEQEREAALASTQAKSDFLAKMSHELRTPLNAIIGFSEMLKSDLARGKSGEYGGIIFRSGHFLLSLINDILDLSKIEAGKLELNCSLIDIPELLSDCVTMTQQRARDVGVEIHLDVERGIPALDADPRAIRQIVLNLISNAVKFTKSTGRIDISAAVNESGELCLRVSDTGVGIRKEDLVHVFDSFGQGRHDVVSGEKGTGLGLPIVRGLAEAHGGRVSLSSVVNRGTAVSVIFPADRIREDLRAA